MDFGEPKFEEENGILVLVVTVATFNDSGKVDSLDERLSLHILCGSHLNDGPLTDALIDHTDTSSYRPKSKPHGIVSKFVFSSSIALSGSRVV